MTPPRPHDDPTEDQRISKQVVSWLEDRRRSLSWSSIAVGIPGALAAAWPLVSTAWDLLGLTQISAWRTAVLLVCVLLVVVGTAGVNWKRIRPPRLIWLILAAWAVTATLVASLTGLAWLLLDTPTWEPPNVLSPRALDTIATRAFAIVAGLGGVALLVISYRRQRTTENGEQREVTKLFNERFTINYTELGSEHAAVRLGAVHALAHLADEAPSEKEVQMVIDILCAYLRMPHAPGPELPPKNASKARRAELREQELEFASFREVRHSIIRVIGDHLRRDTRWRGKYYDFTGAVFDGGDLNHAVFNGGNVSFREAKFTDGRFSFLGAKFIGSYVDFIDAEFSGGELDFVGAKFSHGTVDFRSASFIRGNVNFGGAEFLGALVLFDDARFVGAYIHFHFAKFTGGDLGFRRALFIDGMVRFGESNFSGSVVDFNDAKFTSEAINFDSAECIGGNIDFGWAGFSGDLEDFEYARGSCPQGLPEVRIQSNPGVVLAPEAWRISSES